MHKLEKGFKAISSAAPPMTTRRIHLAKTLTWRVLATFTTFVIAWTVTGDLDVGLIVGGTEAVVKMVLYYLHERAWHRLILRRVYDGQIR